MNIYKLLSIRNAILLIAVVVFGIFVYRIHVVSLRSAPIFNPDPILSIKLTQNIDSVLRLPYDVLGVKEGQNLNTGSKQPDGIKELMHIRNGWTNVEVILFFTSNDAHGFYEARKKSSIRPIYSEYSMDNTRYFVTYVLRARGGPAGGYAPLSYYNCDAVFLIQNLVIIFRSRPKTADDEHLSKTIKYIGNLLNDILNND